LDGGGALPGGGKDHRAGCKDESAEYEDCTFEEMFHIALY
jgi:hypothetical protein